MERKATSITCTECGFVRPIGAIGEVCPVCKKNNIISISMDKNTITAVELIETNVSEPAKQRFECPFCGGRRVLETVMWPEGEKVIHYNLDDQTCSDNEWPNGARIIEHRCGDCKFDLPHEDVDRFFEESETWLPQ